MASLGQWLREEREARSISLEEVAAATKIVPRYLEALESDRLDLMPGAFFIKGIIRTYARAIGLDPEEVLGKYREAGLLAGQETFRAAPPKPIEAPAPRIEEAPVAAPEPPAEPALPTEAASAAAEKAGPTLIFEEETTLEAAAARKRILAWTWRVLAVAVIGGAAFFVLRPGRRPRPAEPRPQAEAVVTQTGLPPALRTDPGEAPSSWPEATPDAGAAAKTAAQAPAQSAVDPGVKPAPALETPVDQVSRGLTIEIVFQAETWIQVRTDGELKVDGLFPPGATARAQADETLLIHTGNAGGFTFRLNGRPAKPLGRSGQVLTDVKITLQNVRDFLEKPSSGLPPA